MVLFFGAVVPRYDIEFKKAVDTVLKFEGLGFSSLWVTDHLQPRRASTILESWTFLSAIASLTDVRLGTTVLCSCYRHPAVLAKMAATLDAISNGRLELGLGLGSESQKEELISLGIEQWNGYERFREYVEVVRLLMAGKNTVNYGGRFYRLSNAACNTPPVQKPSPPIWVGARKRWMVRLAAQVGDGWNFYGETVEEYGKAVAYYEGICKKIGRKPVKSLFTNIVIYTSDAERSEKMKKLGSFNSVDEALRKTFTLLYGRPEEVIKKVEYLQNLGVGLLIVRDMDVESSSISIFADDVMPSFSKDHLL